MQHSSDTRGYNDQWHQPTAWTLVHQATSSGTLCAFSLSLNRPSVKRHTYTEEPRRTPKEVGATPNKWATLAADGQQNREQTTVGVHCQRQPDILVQYTTRDGTAARARARHGSHDVVLVQSERTGKQITREPTHTYTQIDIRSKFTANIFIVSPYILLPSTDLPALLIADNN